MRDEPLPSDQDLLLRVLELPEADRAAFLERECPEDAATRARIARLVAAHERAKDFTGDRAAVGVRLASNAAGDEIGPYRLVEEIGEGGMGTVFLARQSVPIQRDVALKIIKLGMDTGQVVARFEAERQTLAIMDHPGIARVFDAGATGEGRPYFVMEYVRGSTITEYCDRARLSTEERLEMFEQVCFAVQHAHQRGIIHRDLKPSNVLVSDGDSPQPKVIDFGIAKATDTSAAGTLLTVESQVLGTPEYMSPEQASGSGDIDTRTDVYALGVILYELLTGTRPVETSALFADGLQAVVDHIVNATPQRPSKAVDPDSADSMERAEKRGKRPSQLARQIRGDLDWVVLKALEKDRTRRYESASALSADVRRYLSGLPVEAGPPSVLYRATKFASRHRVALAAAAVVLVALAGGVASLAWSLETVKDERDVAKAAQEGERVALNAAQAALTEAEAERDRAEDDRDEAREISDFFTEMIRSASPRREGRDVLVRTIVQQGVSRLEREFADRPAVRARIGVALGGAFGSLGDYERSRELQERSSAMHRELYGPDDPETVLSESELGVTLIQLAEFEEAKELLEDVLARSTLTHGPDSETTLRIRGNLAIVTRELEDYDVAEANYLEVIDDCIDHLGEGHRITLNTKLSLIRMYLNFRQPSKAEAMLTETIDALGSSPAREEPVFLIMQDMQAQTLRRKGDVAGAIELTRQVVTGQARVHGPEHPKTHIAMQDLADLLEINGEYDEALTTIDEVLPFHREQLGLDHPSTLNANRTKGLVLWKIGRLDEAEEVLSDNRERYVRTLGPQDRESRDAANLLAIVHYMKSDLVQALEMWTEQFDAIVAVEGEDDPATIPPRVNLGMVYTKIGRLDEAEDMYRRGLELCLANYGPNEDWTLRVQNNLAELYQTQGDVDAALELNGAVLVRRRQVFGPNHPDTLGSMMNQGALLLNAARPDEAREVLDELLPACLDAIGEEHPMTLNVMMLLGRVASAQDDHDVALELLQFSHEGCVALLGEAHHQTLVTQLVWGEVEDAAGRADEATRIIESCFEIGAEEIADGYLKIDDALAILARIRRESGDVAGAESASARRRERLLRRAEADGASWVDLAEGAEVLLESGETADAERALAFARLLTDRQTRLRPEAQELLARCHIAVDQTNEARDVLERALADIPADHALRAALTATLDDLPGD
ncbi:MAG: serine/threonine-protein kinase [Planctomycetota bacterium]